MSEKKEKRLHRLSKNVACSHFLQTERHVSLPFIWLMNIFSGSSAIPQPRSNIEKASEKKDGVWDILQVVDCILFICTAGTSPYFLLAWPFLHTAFTFGDCWKQSLNVMRVSKQGITTMKWNSSPLKWEMDKQQSFGGYGPQSVGFSYLKLILGSFRYQHGLWSARIMLKARSNTKTSISLSHCHPGVSVSHI